MNIRLNRNIIKILLRTDDISDNKSVIEIYRFYVIARAFFSGRSGLFSLDELCDILNKKFDYKSLHNRPGNKRTVFKKKIHEMFSNSILFEICPDGRFITTSEKKVLKTYQNTDKSSWYQVPDINILRSKGNFRDLIIGVLVSGNKFRSNKNIAKQCKCSVRRIQKATAKNDASGLVKKQFNIIVDASGTKKQIERLRAELFNIHGISSPLPFRYKDEWVLRLNAPNSYRCFALSGVKGFSNAQPTKQDYKNVCWFVPFPQKNSQLKLFGRNFKRWYFKKDVYDLNNYVRDNSTFLN
jgi:hypothetical protein